MTEQTESEQTSDAKPGEVRFNTGFLGCLVLILLVGATLFTFAAFNLDLFNELAETRSRRNFIELFRPFEFGGVNIALLVFVGYLVFEMWRYGRRLGDGRAIYFDGDAIRFHGSLKQASIQLSELHSVEQDAKGMKSELMFRTNGGAFVRVKMVDAIDAEAFVAFVEQAKAKAKRPPPSRH